MRAAGYPDDAPCLLMGDRGDGDVIDLHGLFEQAVEEEAALARAAAVEAERELVEVEVELVRAHDGIRTKGRHADTPLRAYWRD